MLPLDMEHMESAAEEHFREKNFDDLDEVHSEVIKSKGLLN